MKLLPLMLYAAAKTARERKERAERKPKRCWFPLILWLVAFQIACDYAGVTDQIAAFINGVLR